MNKFFSYLAHIGAVAYTADSAKAVFYICNNNNNNNNLVSITPYGIHFRDSLLGMDHNVFCRTLFRLR